MTKAGLSLPAVSERYLIAVGSSTPAISRSKPPEMIVKDLYLAALSRDPSEAEVKAAAKHIKDAKDRRQAVEDIGWVLINSKEFLFRH